MSGRSPVANVLVVAAFAVAGSFAITSVIGEKGILEVRRLQADEAKLSGKAVVLEQENERLKESVRRLKDDDAYIERVAREQQGLVKDGETIYRIPEDQ